MKERVFMCAMTVERFVKNSIVYGYTITQPFAVYVDAYPMLQEQLSVHLNGLQFGNNSESVLHLQGTLNDLGFYDDKLDGQYGLLTEHAVKKFQSSQQIEVTGQVDEQTAEAIVIKNQAHKTAKLEALIDRINYGDKNEDVKIVQEKLFYLGYYKDEIDSSYGPLTEAAIHDFLGIKPEEVEEVSIESSDSVEQNEVLEDEIKTNEAVEQKEATGEQIETKQINQPSDTQSLFETAKSLVGVKYVWGGTSTNGFDCSGYIQYIYKQNDQVIPRTVNEIWNFGTHVNEPSVGDLVFFETYTSGPSHLGLYLGNREFIHAGVSNGVTISNLDEAYWSQRYLGAKRIE